MSSNNSNNTTTKKRAIVVGAGVNGLSSAVALLEDGKWDVKIVAENITPNTTSDGTAALWEPFHCEPEERVLGWSKDAFNAFYKIMKDEQAKLDKVNGGEFRGVFKVDSYEFAADDKLLEFPRWMQELVPHRRARPDEIPAGFKSGIAFETLIVDSKWMMKYMRDKFDRLGGKLELRKVQRITDLINDPFKPDLIVNCTGLAAYQLLGDREVFPIRGQVVKIYAPWVKRFLAAAMLSDNGELIYIIPRNDCVVIGGTADYYEWDRTINPETTKKILQRAQPLLEYEAKKYNNGDASYKIITEWTGLRPGRTSVRLEKETIRCNKTNKQCPIIHNYGHGGAGVTLSLGCAKEVCQLAREEYFKSQSRL